jgi:hypothetical protein
MGQCLSVELKDYAYHLINGWQFYLSPPALSDLFRFVAVERCAVAVRLLAQVALICALRGVSLKQFSTAGEVFYDQLSKH